MGYSATPLLKCGPVFGGGAIAIGISVFQTEAGHRVMGYLVNSTAKAGLLDSGPYTRQRNPGP
jgi:hypothetical protein